MGCQHNSRGLSDFVCWITETLFHPPCRNDLEVEFRNIEDLLETFVIGRTILFTYNEPNNYFPIDFKATRHPETSYLVPKIIHFVWTGAYLPTTYVDNINLMALVNSQYKAGLFNF